MNTKQTREFVRAYMKARGQRTSGLSYTNKNKDADKRNLAFSVSYGVEFNESDFGYLRWMTGCEAVKLTTSDRGVNYLRLVGVNFAG